jgi:hypothetical protein
MIVVKKSSVGDTRTCDFTKVTREQLLDASVSHIGDVGKGLGFFANLLTERASIHDYDKLTLIEQFHSDFVGGFKSTAWWDNHRKIHRHHLAQEDGIPEDINLIDVLEYIADCVMAGMARAGEVYKVEIETAALQKAFNNTFEMLLENVALEGTNKDPLALLRSLRSRLETINETDPSFWLTSEIDKINTILKF